jgi:enterochelin esterase family protein
VYSVVELPDAPSLELINRSANVTKGTKGQPERTQFLSKILHNERPLWIYTPAGDEPDGDPNSLLVLFDGSGYVSLIPVPVVLDNLLAKGRIPPSSSPRNCSRGFVRITG